MQRRTKPVLASRKRQTEALCLEAVQKNAAELRWVQDQTPAVCRAAIDRDVRALQFVKDPTDDLLKYAVQKNGAALQFVKHKTEDLCWSALKSGMFSDFEGFEDGELYSYIKDSGHAIVYIPNPTTEMIAYAVQKCTCGNGSILRDLPAATLTEDFCLEYMRSQKTDRECLFDRVLRYVPHTTPILEYVLSESGMALRHVQTQLTMELYQKAFQTHAAAISYIPHAFQTEAMVNTLFDHPDLLKDMIRSINPTFLTQAFFEKAVEVDLYVFEDCPNKYKTSDFCEAVLERDPRFLEFVPEESLTDAMIQNAIDKNGLCLEYVPIAKITSELCENALLTSNGRAFLYIPEHLRTQTICSKAFEFHVDNIQWIPRAFQTRAMCLKAVEDYGGYLRYCRFKTQAICQKALKNAPGAFFYVPKRLRTETMAISVAESGNKFVWRWFRKSDYTERLCRILITKSPQALQKFPPMFQTRDMHWSAVHLFPRAWSSIPKQHRTLEFLRELLDTENPNIRAFFQKNIGKYDPDYKMVQRELFARGLWISEKKL